MLITIKIFKFVFPFEKLFNYVIFSMSIIVNLILDSDL